MDKNNISPRFFLALYYTAQDVLVMKTHQRSGSHEARVDGLSNLFDSVGKRNAIRLVQTESVQCCAQIRVVIRDF